MAKKTHYPYYDVMKEKEHWDEHTRSIVESRLYPNTKRTFLKWKEEEMLRVICSHLVADQRAKLIDFIISHIDQTLSSSVGEGQRKSGVPEAKVLVRKGLIALNKSAVEKYQVSFIGLDSEAQHQLLLDVSQSRAPDLPEWEGIPQQEFFKKLHTLRLNPIIRIRSFGRRSVTVDLPIREVMCGHNWGSWILGRRSQNMNRKYQNEEVDVVIVGAGAAGGVLAHELSRAGLKVVVIDAGPMRDPQKDFASDELAMKKLGWQDTRIVDGKTDT
jgi:hypothetical protein